MNDTTDAPLGVHAYAVEPTGGRLGPVQAVRRVLVQTFVWSGRARRSEFWWWLLFAAAVYAAAVAVEMQRDPSGDSIIIATVTWFALLPPQLAVTVRRLHDRSFSAWWLLLHLLPFGVLIILILCAFDSWPGRNQYGPDPKRRTRPSSAA